MVQRNRIPCEGATTLDVEQLRTFVASVEAGSFTRASARLHLTHSAISSRIRALEGELGALLFVRHKGSLRLTAAGERFLPRAKRVLAAIQEAHQAVNPVDVRQELHLAASHVLSAFVLPTAMVRFAAEEPDAGLTLAVRPSSEVLDLVLSGWADLSLTTLRVSGPHLRVQPLLQDEIVLVGPRGGCPDIAIPELEDYGLVAYSRRSSYWDHVAEFLEHSGIRMRERFRVDNVSIILKLVAAGVGLSFVPRVALRGEPDGVARIRLRDQEPILRTTYAVYRAGRRQPLRDTFLRALADGVTGGASAPLMERLNNL